MEEEKSVGIEKKEGEKKEIWIFRNSGWTFLIALCILTGIGLVIHLVFRFYNDCISAVFATYANALVMIVWVFLLCLFVLIGESILKRIMLALLAVAVWSGVGYGIYLIWNSIFWSIFGLPVVAFCVSIYLCIATVEHDSSGYEPDSRPWEY